MKALGDLPAGAPALPPAKSQLDIARITVLTGLPGTAATLFTNLLFSETFSVSLSVQGRYIVADPSDANVYVKF